jgi:hypothetical protein
VSVHIDWQTSFYFCRKVSVYTYMHPISTGNQDRQKRRCNYIAEVGPDDVQSGRGRPVISSTGNQRFRELVLQYKCEYSSSNRHAHKDQIARQILATISTRGGRFLRKVVSGAQRKLLGIEDGADAWEIADEEASLNKVKQALREHESSIDKMEVPTPNAPAVAKGRQRLGESPSGQFEAPTTIVYTVAKGRSSLSVSHVPENSAESIRSPKQKRKRESQRTTPMSLAESIRRNASKLGTNLSSTAQPYPVIDAVASTTTTKVSSSMKTRSFHSVSTSAISKRQREDSAIRLAQSKVIENHPSNGGISGLTADSPFASLSRSDKDESEVQMMTESSHGRYESMFATMPRISTDPESNNSYIYLDAGTIDTKVAPSTLAIGINEKDFPDIDSPSDNDTKAEAVKTKETRRK